MFSGLWLCAFGGLGVLTTLWFVLSGKGHKRIGQQSHESKEYKKSEEIRGEEACVPRRSKTSLVVADSDANTIPVLFERSAKKHANLNCLGSRKLIKIEQYDRNVGGKTVKWTRYHLGDYVFLKFKTAQRRIKSIAEGLKMIGMESGAKFGIYEDTRLEWMLAAQACFQNNYTVVTVYTNLGEEALLHSLNEGEIKYLMTNSRNIKKLIDLVGENGSNCPSLEFIIYNDKLPDNIPDSHLKLIPFASIEKKDSQYVVPENSNIEIRAPSPDDLALIMYTSGSTGNPKGVMLSHYNISSAIAGMRSIANINSTDTYIAYLPMAHVLELVAELTMIVSGAAIGYAGIKTLVDNPVSVSPCGDLSSLKPTLMAGVPTVYDRVKKGAFAKVQSSSAFVQWLFKYAYSAKVKAVAEGKSTPLWDLIVFGKFSKLLGGRIRRILSGGAPLSKDTHEFLRVAFSCPVSQGYGLTETCGSGTLQLEDDTGYLKSGTPVPCCEIRLTDCPELGYLSTDTKGKYGEKVSGRGEIWIRGSNVAQGYYKLPEKTASDFTNPGKPDCWFKTGDIGQWLADDGTLQIIDRIKNLVKMSQGEYVALERLESVAKNSSLIDNICVYADSYQSFPVALVNPRQDAVKSWAKSNSVSGSFEELCKSEKLEMAILNDMLEWAKKSKLKSFEWVKNVRLCPTEWTPENGLLSSSNKLKRNSIKDAFQEQIDAMYKQGTRFSR